MAIIKPQVTQENLTAATGPSTLSGMPVLGQDTEVYHAQSHISPQIRGRVRGRHQGKGVGGWNMGVQGV